MQNQTAGLEVDEVQYFIESIPVANYPSRQYSFGQIERAGKLLSRHIGEDRKLDDEVLTAFRIAHNWRLAHAYPMIIERKRLAHAAKGGVVTAGRVKRMASIRKKLIGTTISLREMQDLGGCRAVMPDKTGVIACALQVLSEDYRSRPAFVSDYLNYPKASGYRGLHVVVDFAGAGLSEHHSGQRLEIQIRTKLQHSWSTAQEVIGAVRNEDLKGGKGDPAWQRLMALMADYYAMCDGMPLSEGSPATHSQLCRAIREANEEVGALTFARSIRDTLEPFVSAPPVGPIYKMSMDAVARRTKLEGRDSIMIADGDDFAAIEEQRQTVIVSVDGADDLRKAFPNFYLNITKFATMLGRAVGQRKLHVAEDFRLHLPEFPRGRIRA